MIVKILILIVEIIFYLLIVEILLEFIIVIFSWTILLMIYRVAFNIVVMLNTTTITITVLNFTKFSEKMDVSKVVRRFAIIASIYYINFNSQIIIIRIK